MCLAQGPQRSDAGEARTHGPWVSSQALYHWATALSGVSTAYSCEYAECLLQIIIGVEILMHILL